MTLPGAKPREGLRQRCGRTSLTHIWKDVRLEPIRGWIDAVAEVAPNLVALVAGLAHRDFRVGAASGLALARESLWIYRHLCSPQTWAERVMAERTDTRRETRGDDIPGDAR